jgi:hypothetical protein
MAQLLLATVNGQLVRLDTENPEPRAVFSTHEKNALMGISLVDQIIYTASLDRLYKLKADDYSILKRTRRYLRSPDFHQMNSYDGLLFVTATTLNQIWIYDDELKIKRKLRIPPPNPEKRAKYKKNYNHINTIIKHEEKFYVNLNWLTNVQYGESGVMVLNEDFTEERKFSFGWESHDFMIVDGSMMVICSTSSREKQVIHERRSGLMVDGKLVWEHDPDESFCKGLCLDESYIYMCGGKIARRKKREQTLGVIYVLNRSDYSLAKKIEHPELRGIRGAVIL